MDEIERNLAAYEKDSNAERTIRDTISGAYKDLRPEAGIVAHYENQQLPSFFNAFSGYGMGTGADDMSPLARLQAATGEVGRHGASAQVARSVFDTRRAGMEDLIRSALDRWRTGYTMTQDSWNRAMQERQFAEQQRQFNEQMAAQAAARARASGGVGGGQPNPWSIEWGTGGNGAPGGVPNNPTAVANTASTTATPSYNLGRISNPRAALTPVTRPLGLSGVSFGYGGPGNISGYQMPGNLPAGFISTVKKPRNVQGTTLNQSGGLFR
jgi:hypothetical protein